MMYALIDLRRRGIGVRELVVALENSVVELAARHGIAAAGRRTAPGVYVEARKLASIGLRVRRGCSYHGIALNVDMDLEPFHRINPLRHGGPRDDAARVGRRAARMSRTRRASLRRLAVAALGLEWDGIWSGRRWGRHLFPLDRLIRKGNVPLQRDQHHAAVGQVLVDPVELRPALRLIVYVSARKRPLLLMRSLIRSGASAPRDAR